MTITAIEPRRKSLSAVYIDGEFAVKLDTQTLIENRIKIGCEIDDEQLHSLIEKSNTRRAKEKALWLISYRDHSKKELIDKIKRTADEQSAQNAVERMEELGLVNDESFAKKYANELLNNKHISPKAARYKLIEKGIDKDLIDEILDEIPFNTYEQIQIIINKKYARCLNDEKGRRRAVAGLQRMGYCWSDIKAAINEYINDTEFEE